MPPENEVVDRGDNLSPTPTDVSDVKTVEEILENPLKDAAKEPEKTTEKVENEDDDLKIPRARLKEAVEREREKTASVQARVKELEGHLAAQTTSQDIEAAQKIIKELIKQRNSHLGDGELDKATEIDEKIFGLQEAVAERKAEIKSESSRAQAVETVKYDTIVEKLELEHPELNPDDESYDDEIATEIRALMRGYQSELRLTPSQALQRAAKRVFGTTTKAAVKEDKTEAEGVRRKAEATERNLDAAKKQPASTKEVGLDHDKKGGGLDSKTVMSMSYGEFIKLGDDVLSRLRGDTL